MGTSEASPPKHPSHQATEVIPRRHPPPGATEVVHPKRCLPSTPRFRKPGYTCLPCTYAWCWNGWATGPVPIIVHIYSALIYAHFITHVWACCWNGWTTGFVPCKMQSPLSLTPLPPICAWYWND